MGSNVDMTMTTISASDVRRAVISQLVERRIELGLTQAQLADKIGVRQSHVSRFESGIPDPSVKTVLRIARGLGMELVIVPKA